VNQALGGLAGSIVGWGMWGELMFATAFYMLGFGQYLAGLSPIVPVFGSALAMAALLTLVNYRGVKETGSLQNVTVILLVVLIVGFIVFGLTILDVSLLTPFAPQGWGAVGLTAGTVFVSFIGFEVIATSAEEIEDPARNLPLSMIAAVVTPTLLYVLVMLVSTGTLPVDALEDSSIPVGDVARQFLGDAGSLAMIAGAVLATVSSANASILSAARVNFAMGRDKILADWLNRIHDTFRTPYRAIMATGVVILVLIAGPVPISTLADVAAFMYLVTYALVHVSVIVLREAGPEGYAPDVEIPSYLYPAVPALGLLACLGVLVQMRPIVQLVGAGIVGVGVACLLYARSRAEVESLVGEAIAPEVRAGEDTATDRYTVVVPVANPATEDVLLRYAAAISAGTDQEAEVVAVNVQEVPPQTSLAQEIETEEKRVQLQQHLLERAREAGERLDVPVRTRAIVGRSVPEVLLDVIEDEEADQVLLGWTPRRRRDVVFGTTVDPILERAPCEVTIVRNPDDVDEILALAGRGDNAPAAARHAAQLARSYGVDLRLLNVQPTADEDGENPEAAGRSIVEDVAAAAGLADDEYGADVRVADDVQAVLLDAVADVDTVCVGVTGRNLVAQALYGSIPQSIAERAPGTVLMARGAQESRRTVKEALVQRLGGRLR
jgi:amino acid transporter